MDKAIGRSGMSREAELQRLIEEQARDGDRVFTHDLSLDALRGDGDATLMDTVEDGDDVLLKPRRKQKTKRVRRLLGHRARERQRKRMYGGICEDCGGVTDGSNGRAKAPKVCAKCLVKRADAVPHGAMKKYARGCRCQPCRFAAAHRSWDYYQRKKARAA